MPAEAQTGMVNGIRRDVERNAQRLVNTIRYLRGHQYAVPSPTPKDVVWRQGKIELWRYRSDNVQHGPPLLLMLGLVSRPSLFDLQEDASLVRTLRDSGFDVFVLDWGLADAADAEKTLESYLLRSFPRVVRQVLTIAGSSELSLIGYCMGGNMALMAMAAQPHLPVRNLVTIATAVDWTKMQPQLEPLRKPGDHLSVFIDDTGNVPGEVIGHFFRMRRPTGDAMQLVNLWQYSWNVKYLRGHQAIAGWLGQYTPVSRAASRQIVESWLRDNAFMTGNLRLQGNKLDLKSITCPVLSILTKEDEVVPPESARPIAGLLGSKDFSLVELPAGHIGLIVGRTASKIMYPALVRWLVEHGDASREGAGSIAKLREMRPKG